MLALIHADTMFLGYFHTILGSCCADPKNIHKNDDSGAIFCDGANRFLKLFVAVRTGILTVVEVNKWSKD